MRYKIHDTLGFTWIREELELINRKLDVILLKMEGGRITPELEAAIKENARLTKAVDQKVPDERPI